MTFRLDRTGLLVVDPYNDFISDGGKLWPRVREVMEANGCVSHMIEVLHAARSAGVRSFLAAPSLAPRRLRDVEILGPDPGGRGALQGLRRRQLGRDLSRRVHAAPGDVVAAEHWCSSGFANTDLGMQLKKHGIHQLIVIGLRANTCIDPTVRYGAELGYEVTLVKDAIGSYSWEEMKATLELNALNYARAIVSTKELIASIEKING
jgi:ureidoacrylate peracid hydrolase